MAIQTTYATGPDKGFPGLKADLRVSQPITCKNADTVIMPFGAIVAFKRSGQTSDQDSILPAASTAKLKAVVMAENDFAKTYTINDGTIAGELDNLGLKVGTIFDGLRAGVAFMTCEDGCIPGDPLFVRYAGGTLGAARSTDAGGSTCIDATNCGTWLSTTTATQVGVLEFDFSRKSGI